jgi:hypothetical protein
MKWTRASDVFSFAVLMYEVFSKAALPFQQMTDESLIRILPNPDVSLEGLLFFDLRTVVAPDMWVEPLGLQLASTLSSHSFLQSLLIARHCLDRNAEVRPNFVTLAQRLHPAEWPGLTLTDVSEL